MIFYGKTFAEKTLEAKGRKYDQLKRSHSMPKDDPFPRQPKSVTVSITGDDPRDVEYWVRELLAKAEFKGDSAQRIHPSSFIIHPRAVND